LRWWWCSSRSCASLFGMQLFKGKADPGDLRAKWQSAIVAVCDSAEQLADSRTGALVVLERRTNLSEIIKTGTVLNADITPEMLGTIFYEGTPLHDGAVVVRDGRIEAAGCFLPLSNNLEIGKDMGTRHRAALGMSENSDAVVVVVSEETGIISMAKNGVLIRHFDRQSLYTRLIDEMIPKESTVEKNTADSWVEQAKKLWNWISQKGEDEQQ
jgi:diadenylate cyclase